MNNFILTTTPSLSWIEHRPESSRFLVLGSNFLFSSRLSSLLKRKYPVVTLNPQLQDCLSDASDSSKLYSAEYSKETSIAPLILYQKISTIIITSELLCYLSESSLAHIYSELTLARKLANVRIIYCKINQLPSASNASLHHNLYHQRIEEFPATYLTDIDLLFGFSTFISSGQLPWQSNIMLDNILSGTASQKPPSAGIDNYNYADDLINLLFSYISSAGRLLVSSASAELFTEQKSHDYSIDDVFSSINNQELSPRDRTKDGTYTHEYIKKAIVAQTYCALDIVYRNKPTDYHKTSGRLTALTRIQLGRDLASQIDDKIINKLDAIIPVPETGKYYAQGLSQALSVPYIEAFYKTRAIGRSFDIQDSEQRKDFIREKLGIIPELVRGRTVGIVDEAIFTGATLKIAAELLNASETDQIYLFIPTPECTTNCPYNMQPERSLLSEYMRSDMLASYFDVNGVTFQSTKLFHEQLSIHGKLCTLCFS